MRIKVCWTALLVLAPLSPASGATVSGDVVSRSGEAVPYANILLQNLDQANTRFRVLADERGRFVARDVPIGSYRVTVDHFTCWKWQGAVSVSGEQGVAVDVVMTCRVEEAAPDGTLTLAIIYGPDCFEGDSKPQVFAYGRPLTEPFQFTGIGTDQLMLNGWPFLPLVKSEPVGDPLSDLSAEGREEMRRRYEIDSGLAALAARRMQFAESSIEALRILQETYEASPHVAELEMHSTGIRVRFEWEDEFTSKLFDIQRFDSGVSYHGTEEEQRLRRDEGQRRLIEAFREYVEDCGVVAFGRGYKLELDGDTEGARYVRRFSRLAEGGRTEALTGELRKKVEGSEWQSFLEELLAPPDLADRTSPQAHN